jgi:rare lipoprotein A
MLMATLREGSPAPAPSKVMIAAAKPFISNLDEGKDAPPASASARSFTLSSASTRVAKSQGETPSANRANTKSLVRSASAVEPQADPAPPEAASPPTAFAPMRSEVGTLDLMSGRGLY